MFLVPNIDQMYKEMKKILSSNSQASIVEFGNKHGNGDEFPDFVNILGSVGRSETHIFFSLA